jgi:hypothetical protein
MPALMGLFWQRDGLNTLTNGRESPGTSPGAKGNKEPGMSDSALRGIFYLYFNDLFDR